MTSEVATLDVSWTPWHDPEADIAGYRVWVGSQPGTADLWNATDPQGPRTVSVSVDLVVGAVVDAAELTVLIDAATEMEVADIAGAEGGVEPVPEPVVLPMYQV